MAGQLHLNDHDGLMQSLEDDDTPWDLLSDDILYHIFSYLKLHELISISQTCRAWLRVSRDEFLWKALFMNDWHVDPTVPIAPGRWSWRAEYKRLAFHAPSATFDCEAMRKHHDQILHVCFSHNGDMFATCSKDGFVKIWSSAFPVGMLYKSDMRKLTWKFPQYAQFNESDTLIMVSGIHFGPSTTTGEIAVYGFQGSRFELMCRVNNKPYDVFGAWYNDSYLLSGNLYWQGLLTSCSAIFINKAYPCLESEHESVVHLMLKFFNVSGSSVRTIMIANCLDGDEENCHSKKVYCEKCGREIRNHDQDLRSDDAESEFHDGMMEYVESAGENDDIMQAMDVFERFCDTCLNEMISKHSRLTDSSSHVPQNATVLNCDNLGDIHSNVNGAITANYDDLHNTPVKPFRDSEHSKSDESATTSNPDDISVTFTVDLVSSNSLTSSDLPTRRNDEMCMTADVHLESASSVDEEVQTAYTFYINPDEQDNETSAPVLHAPDDGDYRTLAELNAIPAKLRQSSRDVRYSDRYLIFTAGQDTCIPHQIRIKRLSSLEAAARSTPDGDVERLLPDVMSNLHSMERAEYDSVDYVINLHGHIIGMALSPDHRYLYVNNRSWPLDYHIEDPLQPPPISQDVDVHVIDLVHMNVVQIIENVHKAFTPTEECFFIFLDVSDDYFASGGEDKCGYLMDRHYGICLHKFPHREVVNAVAFNPCDPEMLVTVSDDRYIKVWRSQHARRNITQTSGVV